ncbi:hypothetical protein RchiOBHm_Chr6g0264731 [Rosa chinensis]|uniref:Uncharacterized protein n=1 Tax=Rosa chinensis TaxID=74649 RepID=A0A2P6PP76_ROSCH|nr:hypothetical protein RchiOBHm_Chr6g0264731 [Rosa chinensis]
MRVASEMAFSNSDQEVLDDQVTSLANDGEEKWCDFQRSEPFFLYQPVAAKGSSTCRRQGKSLYKNDKFDTLISVVSEKKQTSNDISESVGPELFDDLCAVELTFDACPMKLESKELREYNILKRQFLEWQNRFDWYKDFPLSDLDYMSHCFFFFPSRIILPSDFLRFIIQDEQKNSPSGDVNNPGRVEGSLVQITGYIQRMFVAFQK